MNEILERVVRILGKLPGIGRRSAERIALKLVQNPEMVDELSSALRELRDGVRRCSRCGAITTVHEDPCRLCTDPHREEGILCVVENAGDVALLERAGAFRGRYHVLGGRLSPMSGQGPDDLRVASLVKRIRAEKVREVVLALDSDVEGDATASYLRDLLATTGVRVTRIALGLPAGSGIAYSDPVTLARAMEGRREF